MAPPVEFPPFEVLPLKRPGPRGNAWGLFGEQDQLGMLNLLTPECVADAAKEITTGVRVNLNWELDKPKHPSFGRPSFTHQWWNKYPRSVNDDSVSFNTQGSSQWDGFRHYGYMKERQWYGGRTLEDFSASDVLGMNIWVANGGIVGRGVLLDYGSYAERNGIKLDHFTSSDIPISALKAIAAESNITFRPGDVLLVRSGFTTVYQKLAPSDEVLVHQRPQPDFIGVQACEETLRWFWENKFAAVASDTPSFERGPIAGAHMGPDAYWQLHQWLLAGWGMPIGEMFYLEDLAEECRRQGRWTFFLTSVPLNVPGGIASPPNAVAIF